MNIMIQKNININNNYQIFIYKSQNHKDTFPKNS